MNATSFFRAASYAAALALTACSHSDSPPPPLPLPIPMIGPAGGTATGPNGAQVVVPANALAANTAIAVDQSSAGSPALPVGMNAFGPIYAFTPHGTTFAVPVTITVPFTAAMVPAGATPALFKTNAAGAWEPVANAVANAGTMTAQVTSFSFLIVGVSPPQITTQPADRTVTEPATATFAVTAIGFYTPFTFQWQKSDDAGATFTDVAGATASSYTTGATAGVTDNGDRYRVLVSSFGGTSTSAAATLTVTGVVVTPTITTQPVNRTASVGGTATFSVVATGTNLVYQWLKNGAAIGGQTNASLNLVNVQAGDAGNYTVVVSNLVNGMPVNNVTSNVATLTVTPPSNIATAKVAAASFHSLALARNGTVYSWGANTFNALGRDPTVPIATQAAPIPALTNVIDIATAGQTSLALLTDGTVRSWGYNGRGLLGIGTITQTPGVQTVSALSGVTRIAMGYSHALALRSDGTVWAWGANVSGAVGDGTKVDRTVPVLVAGLSNVIEIAAGGSNSFALRLDGTVWAWGEDNAQAYLLLGQGGGGNIGTDQLVPIQVQVVAGAVSLEVAETNAFARNASGQLWAWGMGVPGVFDPVATTLLPRLVSNLPVPASYSTGTCWLPTSVNPFGYLLIAQASGVLTVFGDAALPTGGLNVLTNVTDVSAVFCHALALRSDGTVWAAGLNNTGQLGDGTLIQRNAPVQVLGLNLN